jgi:HPt (histidine-containing phosphotransfer) domain-containing protein
MSRILCLSPQDFLRACERIEQSLSNHQALDEGDELLQEILSNCAEHYQQDTPQNRAA